MGPPRRNNNNPAQNPNQHYYHQQQPQNVLPPQAHNNYNGSQNRSHGHSPKSQRTQQYSGNRNAPIHNPRQSSSSVPPQDMDYSQRSAYHAEADATLSNNDPAIVTNTTAVMARPGSALTGPVTIMPNFLPEPASNDEPPTGGTTGATMTAASRYNQNLKVLRRRDASIISIFDQFSHVCVYHHNGDKWEKQGYEGSMFLYERNSYPPYGFYILNRMGREDYIQHLYPEDDVSASKSYLMVRSFPEFTQRRMSAAQAAGVCGPKHMFSEMHSLEAVKLKVSPEEGKGRPQIIGLWTYTNDSREPMMDVMLRLHSFIKDSARYPDEYRYGPDRPPPPNPHARASSASPALSRGAQQTSMDSFNSFTGSPIIKGASASGSMDSMNSNTSELDKLFAKLTPSHGSNSNSNQPSTPKMTLDSLFAAATAATPSGEERVRSSPGPANLFGSGAPMPGSTTSTPAGIMPTTGLPLLDSIFASADVQHSQPSPLPQQTQSHTLQQHPQHQQHQIVAESESQTIPIYSPKPTTTSLPQILNEDVISGLLSRSGSTAPNANATAEYMNGGPGPGGGEYGHGQKSSSRMGSRSRAGSVHLLAPSDGAGAGRTRERGFSPHQGQAKAYGGYAESRNQIHGQQQFDADMTPRAPPPANIPRVMTDSPATMEFFADPTPTGGDHNTSSSSSHHGVSLGRAGGRPQQQFQQQSRSQPQPQPRSQTKYPQWQQPSHPSHTHHRSESSSSTTFMSVTDGNGAQFHSQEHQEVTTSAITISGSPAGGVMTAGAGAGSSGIQPSQQQQQQQQSMPGKQPVQVRPPHIRNLIPFRDDSALWPYPRVPLDDRGESDEDEAASGGNKNQKKDGDSQQQKQNPALGSYGQGQGRKNGDSKDERNDEGDDENDGGGDDDDIIELDFADIKALSDPSMLDKAKKGKGKEKEREKGKGKMKERGSDDGFEKTEKENDKGPTGGHAYGFLGPHPHQSGMIAGRGRGRGRGMFAPIGPGHTAHVPNVNPTKDDNSDKERGGKNRKKGKKERAAEKDRLEKEAIEKSWDIPNHMAATMTQQSNHHNNNNNNGGYQRVLGTPPPPASPSPPPGNEDDSVVVEKLTRAFAKSGVISGRGANFAVTEPAAGTHARASGHSERPRSAASSANGSTRGVVMGRNGETPRTAPMNGGGGMYGRSPQLHHQQPQQMSHQYQQGGESALDEGNVRDGLIHAFNGVRASGRIRISPGTRLEKHEFVRALMTLIQTDQSFVDTLWQDYLTKTGGYALPS